MTVSVYQDKLPPLGFYGIDLRKGSHTSREDGVCAMEAAAWLAGEPHSDRPQCACPVIAAFVIAWNDALPTDEDRNRILKSFIPRLVGTRSTKAIEERRSYLALDWLIRVHAPAWDAAWDAAWAAAWDAACAAERDAAVAALKPTVDQLQASAADLLDRMIAVTEESNDVD